MRDCRLVWPVRIGEGSGMTPTCAPHEKLHIWVSELDACACGEIKGRVGRDRDDR